LQLFKKTTEVGESPLTPLVKGRIREKLGYESPLTPLVKGRIREKLG
jgi:hypothetical protein